MAPKSATGFDRWWKSLRDPLTWTLGASLLIFEAVFRHGQDQAILVIIGGLIGLPVLVRYEERKSSNGTGK